MTHHINLDDIKLLTGAHGRREDGVCVMEAVAWMADLPHSDAPDCTSPVLRVFAQRLNDRLTDEPRQRLKSFIPRLIGTAGDDEADKVRAWMATDWLVRVATPKWLRLAGLDDQAELLESMVELNADSYPSIKQPLSAIADQARALRRTKYEEAKKKFQEIFREKLKAPAAAWAAGAAWAAEAAGAAWAAEAAGAAGAAWAAEAAEAALDSKTINEIRQKVYDVVKEKTLEHLKPTSDEIFESALDLFDRMIDVKERVDA